MGMPPPEFKDFAHHLLTAATKSPGCLKHLQHAVYGNGDETYYNTFMNMPRYMDLLLDFTFFYSLLCCWWRPSASAATTLGRRPTAPPSRLELCAWTSRGLRFVMLLRAASCIEGALHRCALTWAWPSGRRRGHPRYSSVRCELAGSSALQKIETRSVKK